MLSQYPPGPTNRRENFIRFSENPLNFFKNFADQFGEYVYAKIATRDMYLVSDPALLRAVFVELNDVWEKTDHTKDSLSVTGEGLVAASGELHRRHRRLIQPLFTPNWVDGYSKTMVECAAQTAQTWLTSDTVDVTQSMSQLALNVISKTVFGLTDDVPQTKIAQSIAVFQRYSAEILKRSRVTGVSPEEMEAATRDLDEIVNTILAHKTADGTDLISLMRRAVDPETGETLSAKEIRDEAVTFLLAGHETTGNALAWIWYLLAKHPDVEQTLLDEVTRVIGNRAPTGADTQQLPYMVRVIKEALRLYPPVWLIGRRVMQPTLLGGYELPVDASLAIVPYVFHRNPTVFPEPEKFNPDRFLEEPPKYTYLPFGVGPRVCIGQHLAMNEMILAIATILPKCKLVLPADYVAVPDPRITLNMQENLTATVLARQLA